MQWFPIPRLDQSACRALWSGWYDSKAYASREPTAWTSVQHRMATRLPCCQTSRGSAKPIPASLKTSFGLALALLLTLGMSMMIPLAAQAQADAQLYFAPSFLNLGIGESALVEVRVEGLAANAWLNSCARNIRCIGRHKGGTTCSRRSLLHERSLFLDLDFW
jgi:hypothetical protein